MKLSAVLAATCGYITAAKYQADAPAGRWLPNERAPSHVRSTPVGSQVACPTDYNFCIDTKWSDSQTCLFPNPHLIKRCLDEGCIHSSFGQDRVANHLEDTYCKDFMSNEGRFCQWTEAVRCTCPTDVEDIIYANAAVVADDQSVPAGYRIASECVYPSNNMKRMPNGGYIDVPVPGGGPVPPMPDDPKLKGDLFWVDPSSPYGTLRPAPAFKNAGKPVGASSGAVSSVSVSVSAIAAFVMIAAL